MAGMHSEVTGVQSTFPRGPCGQDAIPRAHQRLPHPRLWAQAEGEAALLAHPRQQCLLQMRTCILYTYPSVERQPDWTVADNYYKTLEASSGNPEVIVGMHLCDLLLFVPTPCPAGRNVLLGRNRVEVEGTDWQGRRQQ